MLTLIMFLKICFFILFRVPDAFALYFNLSSINEYDTNSSINITGDANISSQGIQVTPNEGSMGVLGVRGKAGRATYVNPVRLWAKASRILTDFTTHFTFTIDLIDDSPKYADGMAFFLAPFGSSIPINADGSGLGLIGGNVAAPENVDPFVAVEFDTFRNSWDPPTTHVGININSMKSVTNMSWLNNISQGVVNHAWISYNSTSMNLEVTFTGFYSNRTTNGNLNFVVDLRHYLPEWVTIGFSAATGIWFEKNTIMSWEFNSSLQIGENPEESKSIPNPQSNSTTVVTEKKKSKAAILNGLSVGLPVGAVLIIVLAALISYFLWKKNREQKDGFLDLSMDDEFEKGSGPKKFSYNELAQATNNFDEHRKLGEGGFGGVYRGFLGNLCLAVKKVSKGSKQGQKEYASEVKIISHLRHRNLVQLIGWCHDKTELILVYEFMPNGSLDSHLYKETSPLNWPVRYKIAQGVASALLYLHEEWEQCVLHRDIKSSNIMLDSSFNPKLGDFGLARLVDHENGSQTTVLAGTLGYMAPECVITGRANKESDVYSFGVVALEIACGRRPINVQAQEDRVRTVEWVWSLYGMGKLLEAADPKLNGDFDEQEIERLMVVALWCSHPDSNVRPSIRKAINVLNFEAELPILPSKMPVPTYLDPTFENTFIDSQQMGAFGYRFNTNHSNFTLHSAPSSPSSVLLHTQ
ncbi:hypothetical protein ACH5RR_002093 [Cinchona calisaya]|uniref:non-specific serine/threonine protein kinase n=1 Tax=Cinchona calisaya TaxID=153742 RepID=A0ABD3B592_9GENT